MPVTFPIIYDTIRFHESRRPDGGWDHWAILWISLSLWCDSHDRGLAR